MVCGFGVDKKLFGLVIVSYKVEGSRRYLGRLVFFLVVRFRGRFGVVVVTFIVFFF